MTWLQSLAICKNAHCGQCQGRRTELHLPGAGSSNMLISHLWARSMQEHQVTQMLSTGRFHSQTCRMAQKWDEQSHNWVVGMAFNTSCMLSVSPRVTSSTADWICAWQHQFLWRLCLLRKVTASQVCWILVWEAPSYMYLCVSQFFHLWLTIGVRFRTSTVMCVYIRGWQYLLLAGCAYECQNLTCCAWTS